MLTLGTTLAFLELATEEAALPTGLSEFSPASVLMRSAIWRQKVQSIVHTAFFGLNETRGTDRTRKFFLEKRNCENREPAFFSTLQDLQGPEKSNMGTHFL